MSKPSTLSWNAKASSVVKDDALDEPLGQLPANSSHNAAKARKGYWSQDDFSAPRIGRSTAVATDVELIEELRKRGERNPAVLELMRLMMNLSLEPTRAGLMAGIAKTKSEGGA